MMDYEQQSDVGSGFMPVIHRSVKTLQPEKANYNLEKFSTQLIETVLATAQTHPHPGDTEPFADCFLVSV